jgi:hypothetical protein
MRLWFQRNLLLAEAPWPQSTYLAVAGGGDFGVVRGGDLTVVVAVRPDSKVVPGEVTFDVRYASAGSGAEKVPLSPAGGTYVKTFEQVTEPFSFFVSGGDERIGPFPVRVIEPAEVRQVEFVVESPAYMQLPIRRVDGMQGGLSVPPGSWVTVRAAVTKELSAARLLLDGQEVGQPAIAPVTPAGADKPSPGVTARFQVAPPSAKVATMTLRFALTDSEGYSSREGAAFPLHISYDKPPSLTVVWGALSKNITLRAMVPMEIDARDDYGLTELNSMVTVQGVSREPLTLPIAKADPPQRRITLPQAAVDLEPLGLNVGDSVRVWVSAADSLPADSGGPNVRASDTRDFTVVSEEQLLAELLKQQKEMRIRMKQALAAQAAARDRMLAAADQATPAGSGAEVRRLLDESARSQQSVAGSLAGIVHTYQGILAILTSNRAGAEADRRRMASNILEPLEGMTQKPMPTAMAAIEAAGRSDQPTSQGAELARLAGVQQGFYDRMDAVMREMAQLESVQELARTLSIIINVSEEVKAGIQGRLKTRTKGLFDAPK